VNDKKLEAALRRVTAFLKDLSKSRGTDHETIYVRNENELRASDLRRLCRAAIWNDAKKWKGKCPAGLHGLDYEGQRCDLCARLLMDYTR
jgi:hypothetical protein